jgi:catechol 2,3-dioxygenase-like lactoylglutathione lyase family enzyme
MLKSAPLYSYVPVSDLSRARKFYEEKLGLGPGEPAGPGLSFQCGYSTAFFMYPSAAPAPTRPAAPSGK